MSGTFEGLLQKPPAEQAFISENMGQLRGLLTSPAWKNIVEPTLGALILEQMNMLIAEPVVGQERNTARDDQTRGRAQAYNRVLKLFYEKLSEYDAAKADVPVSDEPVPASLLERTDDNAPVAEPAATQ